MLDKNKYKTIWERKYFNLGYKRFPRTKHYYNNFYIVKLQNALRNNLPWMTARHYKEHYLYPRILYNKSIRYYNTFVKVIRKKKVKTRRDKNYLKI